MDENTLVADIRRFNRHYTQVLGLLNKHILDSGYSLTEARVLFEIDGRGACTANDLIIALQIDASYMSRMIAKFQKKNMIAKEISKEDNRAKYIKLTAYGKQIVTELNHKSDGQIQALLVPLQEEERYQLRKAMLWIERYLSIEPL